MLEVGEQVVAGRVCGNLGIAHNLKGDSEKAIEYQKKHLKIAREVGDRDMEERAYVNLGIA